MPASPEILSYDDIRGRADEFLAEYWPDGSYPVDVDYIADVDLGINIAPVSYLMDQLDIDGLYAPGSHRIWVDEHIYDQVYYRYRFTIAHELGHWFLHQAILNEASFSSIEEWKEFYTSIHERERFFYEFQANSFAGLILVQEDPLSSEIDRAVERAREEGFDVDFDEESHCEYLAEYVGRRFEVSGPVIMKRGNHDGYWEYR